MSQRVGRFALAATLSMCAGLGEVRLCAAAPIYVYKKDGVTYFSSKPPASGVEAKVFTGRSSRYSIYKGRSVRGDRLFGQHYGDIIDRAAQRFRVPAALVRAVIHVESAFNPRAVSPKGAMGLMQLMPEVAKMRGVKRPFDPGENIQGGTRHLAYLLERFQGNRKLALAAYNAGEGAVQKYGGVPPYRETQNYVRMVLELETRYAARK